MFDARKTGLLLAACAIVGLSASRVSASVIDFEDGTLGPFASGNGVSVVSVTQTPLDDISEPNGYNQVALSTNSDHVAFNPLAASPADFIRTDAADFDLNSFVIAGAWGSQTLTLQGYNNGSLIHSQTLAVGFDGNGNQIVYTVTLDWAGIDDFRILTGASFTHNNNLLGGTEPGNQKHWALDNLTINEPINGGGGGGGNNDVPEPGTVAMFVGMGVTSLVALRRRK
ncbi:MAG TPA: PEP-CTERM sorting domain-containing protein [Chthonomonadaceae bacterium]|nr:PEP-CTERM sorting domain-containing protein [Chthonomonadaceae bacterium]